MEKKNDQNNIVKTLSILLGVAFFIILILVGILIYLLATKETCDVEIYKDGNGEIKINVPTPTATPISNEYLTHAKQEIIANGNYDTDSSGEPLVYWNSHGTKYHINKNCQHLHKDEEIMYGTLETSFKKGLTQPCRICIKQIIN